MQVSAQIFRNYDVRGVYPTELNDEVSYGFGRAFGTYLIRKHLYKVVVGCDDRASSPALSDSLIQGLVDSGCAVTDIGITLTPIIHFLTWTKDFDAGINVTASHNPKDYNGYRLDLKYGEPFYGDELKKIYDLMVNDDFESGNGVSIKEDLNSEYINFLTSQFKIKRKIKIVVGCGNGATSDIAPKIFETLGCETVASQCVFNSAFPHNVPDPENPTFSNDLATSVLKYHADVGFGFDTDGDRFGFVDEKGNHYTTDYLLLMFAKDLLKNKPGVGVVFDVKSSGVVKDTILKLGGVPHMIRTGHPYFVEAIKNHQALIGAEYSGHIFFADSYFGYDDGLYAACRILQILDSENVHASDLFSDIEQRVSSPEIKIECPDTQKFLLVDKIKNHISKDPKYTDVITVDGIRASISPTAWLLIRASNTNPYLSVRYEGKDRKEYLEVKTAVENLLSV